MGSRCARPYLQTQKIKKSAETMSAREMTRKQTKAKRGGNALVVRGLGGDRIWKCSYLQSVRYIVNQKDIQTLLSLENTDDSGLTPTCNDIANDLGLSSSTTSISGLRPRSRFTPVFSSDNAIDVFYKLVTDDLYKLEKQYILGRKTWSNNLSPQERMALRSLDDIKDIVIKEADKGGNIVIMNRSDYVREIDRQLQDQRAYCKLSTNPIEKITKDIETTLDGQRSSNQF
ncbi:hypothetical protein NDU88_005238 [Pleurodeles waltl]|uniref:Uncharacterized protein n=1 Tax=Pleurodeles waltl TaxID=8319 RepID=A0AAV7VMZ3_PLEWA|nr:hypothetical protein NDU88_005238 [Pleurodeles waltl]